MRANLKIKQLFVGILFVTLIGSCKKTEMSASTGLAQMDTKNVAYGSDGQQKMDIYLPANRTTTSTNIIVLIHGGGWSEGDKTNFDTTISFIKQALPTYAIINLNYRLATVAGANLWPTQITDVNAAFTFILSKQTDYQINTSKIAVLGASAGAHLALLQAYRSNTGQQIKAVIDLFGPTNMTDLFNTPSPYYSPAFVGFFMGGTPTSNPANYLNASPLYFVNASVPATQIFHGTADNVVPIRESDSLNIRLNNAGVKHQYVTYAGEGHGWTDINLIDTYQKIVAFINDNVK